MATPTTDPKQIEENLTKQITQLLLQKAQAKDVLEQIERQIPVLQGQLQLLQVLNNPAEVEEVPVD